jgi:hypothetical protein
VENLVGRCADIGKCSGISSSRLATRNVHYVGYGEYLGVRTTGTTVIALSYWVVSSELESIYCAISCKRLSFVVGTVSGRGYF